MNIRDRAKIVATRTLQAASNPLLPMAAKEALGEVAVFVLECADAIHALQQERAKHDKRNG